MVETERLILTPMSLNDAAFVFALVNTKEYIENIGQRNINNPEEAKKYIQDKMVDHYEKHGFGNFLITRKLDGTKIGCISLYNRDDVEGVDIGFAMLPEYMGKGYAFEGASAIKSQAQNVFKLPSISAFTSKDNVVSQKLIEKLGLSFKNTILFGEENEELLYYELEF